ncbi:PTS glucitol/sorbitol transporter subunit IIC [Selenomonas sputigena]|uniref:PTS glucitol/sorbitol transporter subunit IIC n=1 Tax=Selenomonas sputigena TaxID=69823 RepID=A0ABV3X5S1_9FIRM
MEMLGNWAAGFISLFQRGGESFTGMVTGMLPMIIVLITAVNALINIIGQERINIIAKFTARNILLRYTVLPVLAMFFLGNPMAYTLGRFLPERYKPAYMDSAISFCHPITGLFPHANPAELFVWLGIAQGVAALGLPTAELAVRYFLAGVIAIFIRGLLTERITLYMLKKNNSKLLTDDTIHG